MDSNSSITRMISEANWFPPSIKAPFSAIACKGPVFLLLALDIVYQMSDQCRSVSSTNEQNDCSLHDNQPEILQLRDSMPVILPHRQLAPSRPASTVTNIKSSRLVNFLNQTSGYNMILMHQSPDHLKLKIAPNMRN